MENLEVASTVFVEKELIVVAKGLVILLLSLRVSLIDEEERYYCKGNEFEFEGGGESWFKKWEFLIERLSKIKIRGGGEGWLDLPTLLAAVIEVICLYGIVICSRWNRFPWRSSTLINILRHDNIIYDKLKIILNGSVVCRKFTPC